MFSLLPPNATKWERVLASIARQKLDIPVNIADLWNVEKCPEKFLPWLAVAHSVDYWQADWPVAVKRAAIKGSIYNHSIKGGRKSIKNALLALGITADVTAWHEFEPKKDPYTFEVVAWVTEQLQQGEFLIDLSLPAQAHVMIASHKSARDTYALRIGVKAETEPLGITAIMYSRMHAEQVADEYVPPIPVDVALVAGAYSKFLVFADEIIP